MLTLHHGRPETEEERTETELRCYDWLDSLGVSYDRVDHEPAMTMEICARIDESLGAPICKNLFLCNRQETAFYLLMIPADKPFKTKYLSAQLGVSRLSFGDGKYMEAFLGCTPGSASVLGLMNDRNNRVQLVIDRETLKTSDFGCHPCVNTSSLRISFEELTEKILPALGCCPVTVDLPRE